MIVRRYDTSRLDAVEVTSRGGLRIDARPTRTGVLVYRDGDGSIRRELRHPNEVFAPASLASLRGAPLTDLHPPGPVTPDRWRELAIGHVGDDVTTDGDLVAAHVYVNDAKAIAAIQSGARKELSAGYMAEVVPESGIYNGQPYDFVQRNIIYDHLANGPEGWGRAGPQCALRLDSTDAVAVQEESEILSMATLRIDGKDVAADAAQPAIDALSKARDTEAARADVAEADAKKQKARADTIEKTVADEKKSAERVQLVSDIKRGHAFFLADAEDPPADPPADGDPVALMTEALGKWCPGIDLKGKSPEYVTGAFAVMLAKVVDEDVAEEAPLDGADAYEQPVMQQNGGGLRADAAARKLNSRPRNARVDSGDLDTYQANIAHQAERASKPLAYSKDR